MSDSLRPWNSPGQNTGVGSPSLLQGIFPTQGLNPGIPHCRRILIAAESQGKPNVNIKGFINSQNKDIRVKEAPELVNSSVSNVQIHLLCDFIDKILCAAIREKKKVTNLYLCTFQSRGKLFHSLAPVGFPLISHWSELHNMPLGKPITI